MYFFTVGADEVKAWTIQVRDISRDAQNYIFVFYFVIQPLGSIHTEVAAMALEMQKHFSGCH